MKFNIRSKGSKNAIVKALKEEVPNLLEGNQDSLELILEDIRYKIVVTPNIEGNYDITVYSLYLGNYCECEEILNIVASNLFDRIIQTIQCINFVNRIHRDIGSFHVEAIDTDLL